jgi:alanine racemase
MKKKAEVLNTIEIFSENLINNYELLKSKGKNKELFPVLKANAYGHGIEECVEILDTKKPTYYAVDSYYEALKILKISKTPILIIGPSQINNLEHIVNKKITITISNFNTLDKIVCLNGREVKIHLFFNTGMNREGFVEKDLDKVIKILKENKHIIIDGVLSHFSDADNPQNNYSNFQEKNFSKILDYLEKNNIKPN